MKWTPEVVCPTCHSCTAMRINRNGFLQRKVLRIFGIYPWKCGACGSNFLFRRRGHMHQSSRHASGSHPSDHERGEA
jgi:hypothetical protein